MDKLEDKIRENVQKLEGEFKDNPLFKEYEQTNRNFKTLIEKGVASKRGNNLLSPSDIHIKRQVWFNVR